MGLTGTRIEWRLFMSETSTVRRAKQDLREGKSATTAAGEFVREEIAHVRSGQHGARSARQVIAIGLSKARRAGIPLPAPGKETSVRTRRAAQGDAEAGKMEQRTRTPATGSKKRARAGKSALAREGHRAASHQALSAQARRGRRR
jgi:hypothetical protein